MSLTGSGDAYGAPALEGAQLAVEEANAAGGIPVELAIYDDRSDGATAQEVARQISASEALVVVGPATTPMALAAGPIYGEAGLATIGTTATGDSVTEHPTIFRASFSTSDGGAAIATYLKYALDGTAATVLVRDDGYGQPFASGFRQVAERLGISTDYLFFTTLEEAEAAARRAASDPDRPAIVLGVLVADAAPLLKTIRRERQDALVLGTNTIAGEFFADFFRAEPEEQQTPGYFTDGVYAASPLILDSANAETLAFAERFAARFDHEPSYISAQGYEAARLAISAARTAVAGGTSDLNARRAAVTAYLRSLNAPQRGIAGLNGPLWFTPERGRVQDLRVGRFAGTVFESAPLQIIAVPTPDQAELRSGAVFELGSRRYARIQRVVYTGVYLNAVPRIDLGRASFTADFYLWLRFGRDRTADAADPTNLIFPSMASGSFQTKEPMKQQILADGTEYWLWRVQGEFRNDFDLRRYPFDRQTLALSFFNAQAATDQIVYVVDRRGGSEAEPGESTDLPATDSVAQSGELVIAAPDAFRNLSQWEALRAEARRENLATDSALGDPTAWATNNRLELSGFLVRIDVERRALSTLSKTVLPLFLMTLIMFASLFFPAALVKEKVTVAITAALSGAVLLTAINSQLGAVGYTILIEYAFYIFFALALLCIVTVLLAERWRVGGRGERAIRIERGTQIIYALTVLVTTISATFLLN